MISFNPNELLNVANEMIDMGIVSREEISEYYNKQYNSMNPYSCMNISSNLYSTGEYKFDINNIKSWFKREDFKQFDFHRNYDVAIIKLKHYTGCTIIDDYICHFYKAWIRHGCYFSVIKTKSLASCEERSSISISTCGYDIDKETNISNIKSEDLYYLCFGIMFKDILKLVSELGEDFVYNELKEVLLNTKGKTTDYLHVDTDKIEKEIKEILKD